MKNTVNKESKLIMRERDIRDRGVLDKYLRLVEEDVRELFDPGSFAKVPCPACGNTTFNHEFIKSRFTYVTCVKCATLFANPRPSFEMLNKFYSNSTSTSFWIKEYFEPFIDARTEKIFQPRAEYINNMLDNDSGNKVIGDAGAGFGIFLDEMRKLRPQDRYIAIEPSAEMADICRAKGLETKCVCLESLDETAEKFDLITAFELFEHLFDPMRFMKKARALLKPGGHLFVTTLNGEGFDIMVLWEKSKSLMPPHHLNFFNPSSIRTLYEKVGFQTVEISTPGKLDWDIVEGTIRNNEADPGKFWNYFASRGSLSAKTELQEWISRNSMSSHMRILAKKE